MAEPSAGQVNLLANAGFEQTVAGSPSSWIITNRAAGGAVTTSASGRHNGSKSLALSWLPSNQTSVWVKPEIGVGQAVSTAGALGKTMYVSGWLSASGDAKAVLTALAYRSDGYIYQVQMRQVSTVSPVLVRDQLAIPNDPRVMFAIVLCEIEGTGTVYFDDLSASFDRPLDWLTDQTYLATSLSPFAARVTVDAGSPLRTVPSTFYGQNLEWIWNGNGIWDATLDEPKPAATQLTQNLGVKLLRFPGGIMADYYNWRDGVGPVAGRPTIQSMPGGVLDKPYFGTDEALRFASSVGAELLVTVNAGTGTPEMAADWVRYVNQSGLKVRYWEIGNELYANSGVMFAPVTMTPSVYANTVVAFAKAMRKADSRIKIGAIACESTFNLDCPTYPGWTATVLQGAASEIDFLSVHNSYAPGVDNAAGVSTVSAYMAMLAAPEHIRRSLNNLSRKVSVYAPARSAAIKLAVTEWGPYFAYSATSRFVEHTKTMASAVFVASAMKVFLESSQTEVTNAFQLLDGLFTGWIGTRDGQLTAKPSYHVMQMFTRGFGSVIVSTSTVSPSFDTVTIGSVPAATGVAYVESVASKSVDGKSLYIVVWNKNPSNAAAVDIQLRNFIPSGTVEVRTVSGTTADAHTGTQPPSFVQLAQQATLEGQSSFNSGSTPNVFVQDTTLEAQEGAIPLTVQPMAVILLKVPGR